MVVYMWKESLRIGVDAIDAQHKKLFENVGNLVRILRSGGTVDKQKCVEIIHFLEDYMVTHFEEEEAYLTAIKYPDFYSHKKLHEGFKRTVNQHAKILEDSDFSPHDVNVFVGILAAWLLYHVTDADRRYTHVTEMSGQKYMKHEEMVLFGVSDVLEKMVGLPAASMKVTADCDECFADSVSVKVGFTDGAMGYTNITYPTSFIKDIVNEMLNYTPETIGELEMSAIFEMSNIIGGTVCRQITAIKGIFCDIKPPIESHRSTLPSDERFVIDTGKGAVEVALAVSFI
ncbi:MAG: bacteriohemerythrin [Oscillospiraceae bacterium]|nr:bacteriohemerythrin [Oscillospiraceae bacterium]